jgi:hypothetical protein
VSFFVLFLGFLLWRVLVCTHGLCSVTPMQSTYCAFCQAALSGRKFCSLCGKPNTSTGGLQSKPRIEDRVYKQSRQQRQAYASYNQANGYQPGTQDYLEPGQGSGKASHHNGGFRQVSSGRQTVYRPPGKDDSAPRSETKNKYVPPALRAKMRQQEELEKQQQQQQQSPAPVVSEPHFRPQSQFPNQSASLEPYAKPMPVEGVAPASEGLKNAISPKIQLATAPRFCCGVQASGKLCALCGGRVKKAVK